MAQAPQGVKLVRPRTARAAAPDEEAATSPRFVLLEGTGQPDCPQFFAGLEALEGVAALLRTALERSGRKGELVGPVERSWNFRHDERRWRWKVRAEVPRSVTASALELAKHLVGRGAAAEPIALLPDPEAAPGQG